MATTIKWSTRLLSALVCALLCVPAAAWAQSGQRLADQDVKKVIEAVNETRDRFEDQLDGGLKNSILRGPKGEVRVRDYLDDFQKDVEALRDRFSPQYAASNEAAAVLTRGTAMHAFMSARPREIKGGSEWDRLSQELSRLAEVYRTTFPLPDGATVRRFNDAEAASTADAVARQADLLKKEIGREKSVDKSQRDSVRRDLDQLMKQAKTVKSRASGGKPATAEVRQVLALSATVGTFMQGKQLTPGTLAAWGAMRAPLDRLAQAYGM